MVSTEVRHRRGTDAQNTAFTGAQGELIYTTDLKELYVHDALTPGGIIVSGVETGTVMLFHQSAAPTGWTKTTAATLDDHAIRIVTSTAWTTGSLGGADLFTDTFGSGKSTSTYALLAGDLPSTSHTHTISSMWISSGGGNANPGGGSGSVNPTTDAADPTSGIADAHGHNLSAMDISYADMIIATKD